MPTLDEAVFRRLRRDLGDATVADLVASFLADARALVEEIGDAARQADRDRARGAAHKLKSTASLFGATALESACRAVEDGSDRAVSTLRRSATKTATEFAKVSEVLGRRMRTLRSTR